MVWQIMTVVLVLFTVSSWLVHVGTCFVEGTWGFLIAGAVCFPVGIVHGAGVMFGLW